jgi:hypothetical protein
MAVSHVGSQSSGAAALAQVTSDATKEGEIRAQAGAGVPSGPGSPWPAGLPERLCTARMRLGWSSYGTVPRVTTHRAACPVIFAIRS